MQPDQLLAVLTGDLIESQKYPDHLETALDIINHSFQNFLVSTNDPAQHIPIAKFRADSFQAVMGRPEMALRAAVFIRANLVSTPLVAVALDARIAIGIGKADSLNTDNISLSAGRPFRKSGLLLDK